MPSTLDRKVERNINKFLAVYSQLGEEQKARFFELHVSSLSVTIRQVLLRRATGHDKNQAYNNRRNDESLENALVRQVFGHLILQATNLQTGQVSTSNGRLFDVSKYSPTRFYVQFRRPISNGAMDKRFAVASDIDPDNEAGANDTLGSLAFKILKAVGDGVEHARFVTWVEPSRLEIVLFPGHNQTPENIIKEVGNSLLGFGL